MTVHQQEPPSSYRRALETARALGHADGCLAADLESDLGFDLRADTAVDPAPPAVGTWCRGLDPERFAALVWGGSGGAAPAGVVLNAPLWYLQGFGEALARARSRPDRHAAAATPSGSCRPPAAGRDSGPPAWRVVPRPRSEPA